MAGWTAHKGKALVLPLDHVDTDQLIPARFMSTPRHKGYGDFLFHDLRRDDEGALHPDFALNRVADASILVAGHNFGSGSSREAAVYALIDAGFRVVIAPSFGDIFAANAINNGLLPARIDTEHADGIQNMVGDGAADLHVDLDTRRISLNDHVVPFELDEHWRIKLVNGWDDVDLTHQHDAPIRAYKDNRIQNAPWAWPGMAD